MSNAQHPQVVLCSPASQSELEAVRALFLEYAEALAVDLCFQNFDAELHGLPGEYAGPRGALLVAKVDGVFAGCCAIRPLDSADYANACEMKRLYVRPAFRGLGLGRKLAEGILELAQQADYAVCCLIRWTTWSPRGRCTKILDLNLSLRTTSTRSRVPTT